nr:hypothetical protein CFP56_30664 [Quercus suber]
MGMFIASLPLAMSIYSNPDASNWWIPGGSFPPFPPTLVRVSPLTPFSNLAVILGAAIPMSLTLLLCGPWTMAVQLHLPSRARRSHDELQRFVSRLPPHAGLALQFMRWKPWPTTRQVTFADLRRLRPSYVRMSNLEHMPDVVAAKMQTVSRLRAWIVRRYMGQFWVVMDDASGGKGVVKDVWKQVWEQIPVDGEEVARREMERVALPAEMPAVRVGAAASVPPQEGLEGLTKPVVRTRKPPPPLRGPLKSKRR